MKYQQLNNYLFTTIDVMFRQWCHNYSGVTEKILWKNCNFYSDCFTR